jgi:hypothetical protein
MNLGVLIWDFQFGYRLALYASGLANQGPRSRSYRLGRVLSRRLTTQGRSRPHIDRSTACQQEVPGVQRIFLASSAQPGSPANCDWKPKR